MVVDPSRQLLSGLWHFSPKLFEKLQLVGHVRFSFAVAGNAFTPDCPPRPKWFRRRSRARLKRDFTVPSASDSASAISASLRSAHACRRRTSRSSCRRSARAAA